MQHFFYIRRHCTELALPVLPCGFDAGALRQIVRIGLPLGLNSALYSIGHVFFAGAVQPAGVGFCGGLLGGGQGRRAGQHHGHLAFAGDLGVCGAKPRLTELQPSAQGRLAAPGGLGAALPRRRAADGGLLPPLLLLFTQDEAVLAFAVRYIRVVLPFQWCYAAFNAIMSFANGMGEIRYSTIVNIILLWGVRSPGVLPRWRGWLTALRHGGCFAQLCCRAAGDAVLL